MELDKKELELIKTLVNHEMQIVDMVKEISDLEEKDDHELEECVEWFEQKNQILRSILTKIEKYESEMD